MPKVNKKRRRKGNITDQERNYGYLFTTNAISEALFEELAGTVFSNDLSSFRKTDSAKSHRSIFSNFWKNIATRIINSEKDLHRDTVQRYSTDCYWAFKRKFQMIEDHFKAKISGKSVIKKGQLPYDPTVFKDFLKKLLLEKN